MASLAGQTTRNGLRLLTVAGLVLAFSATPAGAMRLTSAPTADPLAKLQPTPRTYVGLTSQFPCGSVACGVVNINLAKKTHRIKRFLIGWTATCNQSDNVLAQGTIVSRTGTVTRKRVTFAGSGVLHDDLGDGFTDEQHIQFAGKLVFAKKKATGTYSNTIDVFDPTGAQIDTCSTGNVTWSAKPLPKN